MRDDSISRDPLAAGTLGTLILVPALWMAYFLLGLVTGIYGMCATAPERWDDLYSRGRYLFLPLGLVSGIVIGLYVFWKNRKIA